MELLLEYCNDIIVIVIIINITIVVIFLLSQNVQSMTGLLMSYMMSYSVVTNMPSKVAGSRTWPHRPRGLGQHGVAHDEGG